MARSPDNSVRVSQTQSVIAVVVIGAILIVGAGVVGLVADSVPATERAHVDNESFTATIGQHTNSTTYTVNDENDPAIEGDDEVDDDGFDETVVVTNNTAGGTTLTDGTHYEWFDDNGTVKLFNASIMRDGTGDPNGTYFISYDYDTRGSEFHSTQDRIGDGILIGGVVVIVVMAAVILRVLRGL